MLRHQIMCEQDVRAESFLDGQWVRVRRDRSSTFRDDDTAPLYGSEDPGPSGLPMLLYRAPKRAWWADVSCPADEHRSEEHTSELQSLMRISYAAFCLKKKKQ